MAVNTRLAPLAGVSEAQLAEYHARHPAPMEMPLMPEISDWIAANGDAEDPEPPNHLGFTIEPPPEDVPEEDWTPEERARYGLWEDLTQPGSTTYTTMRAVGIFSGQDLQSIVFTSIADMLLTFE